MSWSLLLFVIVIGVLWIVVEEIKKRNRFASLYKLPGPKPELYFGNVREIMNNPLGTLLYYSVSNAAQPHLKIIGIVMEICLCIGISHNQSL